MASLIIIEYNSNIFKQQGTRINFLILCIYEVFVLGALVIFVNIFIISSTIGLAGVLALLLWWRLGSLSIFNAHWFLQSVLASLGLEVELAYVG